MKPILETESCLFNRRESLSLASAWCLLQFMKPLFLWMLVTYVRCLPPPHKQSRWDRRLIKSHSNWSFGTNRYSPAGCCQGGFAVCQQTTTKIWMDPSINGESYSVLLSSVLFQVLCAAPPPSKAEIIIMRWLFKMYLIIILKQKREPEQQLQWQHISRTSYEMGRLINKYNWEIKKH